MSLPAIEMEITPVENHFNGEPSVRCDFQEITWEQGREIVDFIEEISAKGDDGEVIWNVFAQPGADEFFGLPLPVTLVRVWVDFTDRDDLVMLMKLRFGQHKPQQGL